MKIFISLLLSCFLLFYISLAQSDTLTQGQSIKDGETLLSSSDVFELGFFSPGNSTSRYAGIWYRNSKTVIIWVANRDTPLTDTSGSLNLSSDGNIIILDAAGHVVWTTNSSTASTNSTAQLTDSGNLKILNTTAIITWQSFDYPADTFVPSMKISRPTHGNYRILTSWKSPDDPSTGKYTLGLDTRGSSQFFIWEEGKPRWRSGQWDGITFIGTVIRPLNVYGFKRDSEGGIMYFTFTPFNTSLLRFVMQSDGNEKTSMKVDDGWKTVWKQPLYDCDIYGKCGDHGVCVESADNGEASCSCLKGFVPRSSQEWSKGNWTGGCVRRTPLQCSSQLRNGSNSSVSNAPDGFFAVEGVKLPDLSDWASTGETEDGCQSACSNNCSCKAYAYPRGIGCLIWGDELIDIYQFPQGGNALHIKLPASELGTSKKKTKLDIIIPIVGVASAALIICLLFWWKCNARLKNWRKGRKGESSKSLFLRADGNRDFSGPSDGGDGQEGTSSELPFYRFNQMSAATNKFNDSNKLGQGGFGPVYKGILPGGQEIAVKRLSANSGQGLEELKNEVILIAKLQHRNLVRLMGCCIEGDEKILIYEYMPNKSLDAFLFEPTKQQLLDWRRRFNIIEGIARGLLYLHRDSRLRIIHRDLKASNILLDEQMNPKISDFGMARIFGSDQNQANTNRVVGTYGYMSPEYAMEGLFSVKSDVYSFGVLVLEIVMGKRNSRFNRILGYAWQLWSEDRVMELIDESIRDSCSTIEVQRCIHVALLCVQDHDTERPDMATVVIMLGSETANFPAPNQPKFTMGEVTNKATVVNEHESFSAGDMTITALQGR